MTAIKYDDEEGDGGPLTPRQKRQGKQIVRCEDIADGLARIAHEECGETPTHIRRAYKKMQRLMTKLGAEIAKL